MGKKLAIKIYISLAFFERNVECLDVYMQTAEYYKR